MDTIAAKAEKKHIYFIDLLRVIACFLVIVNHTNSQIFENSTPSISWLFSIFYFFLSKTAVPVFIMITGYTMLSAKDSYRKNFVRLLRYGTLLILFSGVYYIIDHLSENATAPSLKSFVGLVIDGSITNSFWYMYLYLGILLMIPFLQKLALSLTKTDYDVFFLISGFFLSFLPIIIHYIPALKLSSSFLLPLFDSYIAFLFLGQYFRLYCSPSHKWRIPCAAGFLITAIFSTCLTYYEYKESNGLDYLFLDNTSLLPIVIGAFCLFAFIATFEPNGLLREIVSSLSKLTLGIYLLSDLMIEKLEFVYQAMIANHIHSIFAMVLYEIVVFLACAMIIWILRKIPFLKKII